MYGDGTWTDYIYANGQKIARADTFDNYIKITGTSTAVGNYVTYTVPTPTDLNGYQIQAGDTLYVREWQSGGIEGGIGFMTTEGASTNGLIFDQNGYPGDDDPLKNQWHLRTISLTPVAGKHFAYMTFGGGSGAGQESGAYSVYFTDMVIVGANGEVHPLYTGQPSASVSYVAAVNMTGLAESIGQNITNGESHFYLSDDLNSVRMVLGGWPLSESTYTPFGQEVNATISGYNNTYKFTGMELDAETDLDHTWFRQYASSQGRWMTPDPYNGSYDLTNPQSMNRYGYVNNSPTTAFDPSGLHEASCYNIIHCNPSLFWGGGVPGGSSWDEFDFMMGFTWVSAANGTYGYPTGDWNTMMAGGYGGGITDGAGGSLLDSAGDVVGYIGSYTGTGNYMTYSQTESGSGNWLLAGLNYIKTHPVFISVNEIFAAQITYQASTNTICANVGLGASVLPTKAFTVGVYNGGTMENWTNVLSSWGYSFGANLFGGYQASINSSGTIGGPSASPGIGLSGSYTWGACGPAPW